MAELGKKTLGNPVRRKILKTGLVTTVVTAGYGFIKPKLTTASEGPNVGPSPFTTPFVVPLPIPAIKQPVEALNPPPQKEAGPEEAGRLPHQRWEEFLPKKLYEVHVREQLHSFHPELPAQPIWGYDGTYPGPTFVNRIGTPILVRYYNELPQDHTGFGSPEISVHQHGGHTATESDGYAGDYFSARKFGPTLTRPGKYYDYHYPLVFGGFDESLGTLGDPRELKGTQWYHDHRLDFTAANVYKGMVGFYLVFNELDSGDENDPNPNALHLPSGVGRYDIPLNISAKRFDSSGMLYFDQFSPEGIVGDKYLVNGKIQPYFKVERRKYRFRLLNGATTRIFDLFLTYKSKDQEFKYIASDGDLLPAPLTMTDVPLAMAERADIVVDFSKYPIGSQLFLVNRLEQTDPRGPDDKLVFPGTPILCFDVERDPPVSDVSRVPDTLLELPPVNPAEIVRTRLFEFDRTNGQWAVNNRFFDPLRTDANPKQGIPEIWILKNGGGGWWHPIHIHLEDFQILSRNGKQPPPHERGRKDVVLLHPGEEVRVRVLFRDFLGKYVMHCHNTVHEDHAMMIRWDVIPRS